ncbi:unnamed protein product [Haemonchus placei]|uniref:Uncharacterized protein n=1 Tax=Haemonchus placei TaxID=6290 RepID=A0A0N4XB42_HAEPC|nr:unnamed protein product [Haemonchus placei]
MMEVRRRITTASANGTQTHTQYELLNDKARRTSEAIGFKHWIFVIAVVGIVYGAVVYLHRLVCPLRIGLLQFCRKKIVFIRRSVIVTRAFLRLHYCLILSEL